MHSMTHGAADRDGKGIWKGWWGKLTLASAVPICSLKYCCVRAAKGVTDELIPSQCLGLEKTWGEIGTNVMFLPNAWSLSIVPENGVLKNIRQASEVS